MQRSRQRAVVISACCRQFRHCYEIFAPGSAVTCALLAITSVDVTDARNPPDGQLSAAKSSAAVVFTVVVIVQFPGAMLWNK